MSQMLGIGVWAALDHQMDRIFPKGIPVLNVQLAEAVNTYQDDVIVVMLIVSKKIMQAAKLK